MKQYVVGFLFSSDRKRVLLIRKDHPRWQVGRLNGPGGKVENGETPAQAMEREFLEEIGAKVEHWIPFCITSGELKYYDGEPQEGDYQITYFCRDGYDLNMVAEKQQYTDAKEKVIIVKVEDLPRHDAISNLYWLIPMALVIMSPNKNVMACGYRIQEDYEGL